MSRNLTPNSLCTEGDVENVDQQQPIVSAAEVVEAVIKNRIELDGVTNAINNHHIEYSNIPRNSRQ